MDECRDAFATTQSAKRFFGFQESRSRPAQRHLHIAIASHAAADPPDHGIRGLDDVGRRQATRQLAGHAKAVDREQLLEPFEQAGGGIGMLGLEVFGVRFELLDAGIGVALERLSHHPAGLLGLGPGQAFGDIADLVNPAALNVGSLAAQLLDSRTQRLRTIDHPQPSSSAWPAPGRCP